MAFVVVPVFVAFKINVAPAAFINKAGAKLDVLLGLNVVVVLVLKVTVELFVIVQRVYVYWTCSKDY